MIYFIIKGKITEQEIKKQWRKLALIHHPDKGGDQFTYIAAQAEYEDLQRKIGITLHDNVDDYNNWDDFLSNIAPNVNEAFAEVSKIPEIREIEICGYWIWIDLEKQYTEARVKLKSIDIDGTRFRFSRNKKLWYFAGIKSYARRRYSIDEIRGIHGSKIYQKDEQRKVTA